MWSDKVPEALSHSLGPGETDSPRGGNEAPDVGKLCAGGKQKVFKRKPALHQHPKHFLSAV